jgi:hypothetical protein
LSDQEIARIEEQIVTLFKNDERMERAIEKLGYDVQEIKDEFANRLPTWATIVLSILTASLGVCLGCLLS